MVDRIGRLQPAVVVVLSGFLWMGCELETTVVDASEVDCSVDADCNDDDECGSATCEDQQCVYTNVANDTACSGGTCQNGVCEPDTAGTCEEVNVLVNGDFDTGDDSSAELLPTTFGQWVGDQRMIVSMGDDGITPVGGSGLMLEFLAATPVGPSAMSNSSEVRQAVNLSACEGTSIQVEGKAQFNRIEGDAETAKTFTLFLWAFDGPLSELPDKYKQDPDPLELAEESEQVIVEEVGWEEVSVTMDVPAGTDYVLFELIVNELVPKDNMEFDGQFADAASLTVSFVPAP